MSKSPAQVIPAVRRAELELEFEEDVEVEDEAVFPLSPFEVYRVKAEEVLVFITYR